MSDDLAVFICAVLAAIMIAAWSTSVIVCIRDGGYMLLLVDFLAWPVGVTHGLGVWCGLW